MHVESLYAELRLNAPSVVFSASREVDPYYTWDGDGQDPVAQGYEPCTVRVTASCIVDGYLLEADDVLCGCYFQPDEATDDVHGYLPQMIQEAAIRLAAQVKYTPILLRQLAAVDALLSVRS